MIQQQFNNSQQESTTHEVIQQQTTTHYPPVVIQQLTTHFSNYSSTCTGVGNSSTDNTRTTQNVINTREGDCIDNLRTRGR